MKKRGIIIVVLIAITFLFYVFLKLFILRPIVGPCNGYSKVGYFNENINSEEDARNVALNYYKSIGYNFQPSELSIIKTNKGYSVKPFVGYNSTLTENKLCVGKANPPECIGQELILENDFLGNNRILMEYQIPC